MQKNNPPKQHKNYYYTRRKFGRWKFFILINLLFTVFYVIGFFLSLIYGFEEGVTIENAVIGIAYASFGNILTISLTEIGSNLSYSLIEGILNKKIVVGDQEELRDRAISFIWSKWVYAFTIFLYIFPIIGTTYSIFTGRAELIPSITAYFSMFLTALIDAEFIWIVFSPVFVIFYLSFIPLEIDVFSSDLAGGLSPISSYLLKVSLLLTLFGTAGLVWIVQPSYDNTTLLLAFGILLVILSLPIIYFIVPTVGLNKIMKEQKQKVLQELDLRFVQSYKKLVSNDSEIDQKYINQMELANILRNQAQDMNEWPFSFSGLRNLLTSFLLPIGVFLLNNIEQILSYLSF